MKERHEGCEVSLPPKTIIVVRTREYYRGSDGLWYFCKPVPGLGNPSVAKAVKKFRISNMLDRIAELEAEVEELREKRVTP